MRNLSNFTVPMFVVMGIAGIIVASGHVNSAIAAPSEPVIEEVVVTAQRREQRIQDVSMSISAFDESTIRNLKITRLSDLGQLTPGLSVKQTGNLGNPEDPIFVIRGIGMLALEANANPTVSVYLDDVNLPFFPMVGLQLFDTERIEVLKGPQGTLYGRNNTGGAVNVITRKPTQEFTADLRADIGQFDRPGGLNDGRRSEFEGGVGFGITENLAVRFAANITDQDGFQKLSPGPDAPRSLDDRNGEVEREAVRASALWTPAPNFDLLVTVDAAWDESEVQAFAHAGNSRRDNPAELCSFGLSGVRSEGPNGECGTPALRRTPDGQPVTGDIEFHFDDTPGELRNVAESFTFGNRIDAESQGANVTANWEFPRFTLTSVTGYRDFERSGGSGNGIPFVISDRTNTVESDLFRQELRLTSNETFTNLDWIVGIFYSDDTVSDDMIFDFQDHFQFFGLFFWEYEQQSEQVAPFANMTWSFAENFDLNVGVRFTREDREIHFAGDEVRQGPNPVPFFQDDITTNDVSGTIGIDYKPDENWLIYGKISKGFKGAGFPASIAFQDESLLPFDKETIIAWEGGFKSTLQNGRLQLNSSVYYYDWRDFQAETSVERQGIRLIVLDNAGDAQVQGIEAQANWNPAPGFTVNLGVNWMDAEITDGEFDGNDVAQAPDVMLNGYIRWDSPDTVAGVHPFVQFDFSFQDEVEFEIPNHPGATEDSFWLTNARVGVRTPDRRWEVAAWIRNIADETYRTDVFGPGSTFLPGRILVGAPRMFGASVSYSL